MAATESAALGRHFHNTGVYNGFGAAAGNARLLGLVHPQGGNALAIGGSHPPCLAEAARTGLGWLRVGLDRMAYSTSLGSGPDPKDMTGANYSTHYSLGLTVAKRSNEFATYLEAARDGFQDPEILRIAHLVETYLDPECDADFPDQW